MLLRFNSLQHLSLDGCCLNPDSSEPTTLPPTLESIDYVADLLDWPYLISHPSMRQTSLTSLSISLAERCFDESARNCCSALDFAQWLPATVVTLRLDITTSYRSNYNDFAVDLDNKKQESPQPMTFLRSLPPSLTSLAIESTLLATSSSMSNKEVQGVPLSMVRLQDLPNLKHLELTSYCDTASSEIPLLEYGRMPTMLKSLHIHEHAITPLTATEIESLPSSLETLRITSFNMDLADTFRSHFTDCHLYIIPQDTDQSCSDDEVTSKPIDYQHLASKSRAFALDAHQVSDAGANLTRGLRRPNESHHLYSD